LTACESVETRKEYYANGTLKSESEYINDVRNGRELQYDSTGAVIIEQFFKNDSLDGVKTTYYVDGRISEIVNYKSGQKQGDFFKFYSNGYIGSKGTNQDGKTLGMFFVYDPYDSGRITKEAYLVNWNNEVFQYYVKRFEPSGESRFEHRPLTIDVPRIMRLKDMKFAEIEFNEMSKYDSVLIVVEFSVDRINNDSDLDTLLMKAQKIKYQLMSTDTGAHFLRGFVIGSTTTKNTDEPDSLLSETLSTYYVFEERVHVRK
jgi:antitoxin component YwqK of YwqJK toxin-antitoxin module